MKKWMRTSFFIVILAASYACFLAAGVVHASKGSESDKQRNPVTLEFKNDLLTIEATKANLGSLLQELAKKSGCRFIFEDVSVTKDAISCSVKAVSLENGLKRILKKYSYASRLNNNTLTITIFGHKGSLPQSNSGGNRAIAETPIFRESTIENSTITDQQQEELPAEINEESKPADFEAINKDQTVVADTETSQDTSELSADEPQTEEDEELAAIEQAAIEQAAFNEQIEEQLQLESQLPVHNPDSITAYHVRLKSLVGSNEPQATEQLFFAASGGDDNNKVSDTTKMLAAEGLWRHAADYQFSDRSSIAALQRLAQQDSDPAVKRIAEAALLDMEQYYNQQATTNPSNDAATHRYNQQNLE